MFVFYMCISSLPVYDSTSLSDLKSTLTARYNYWNDLVLDKNLEGLMNMYEDDCMLSLFHQKPIFGKQGNKEF